MEKLMETKLPWTGPNLRVKVEVEAEEVSEAEVVAEEEEADLVDEVGEALEAEEASEAAEEEGETSSHKERRRSLNSSFHPILSLILKKGLWGFYSVTCSMTEPSKDIPRQ